MTAQTQQTPSASAQAITCQTNEGASEVDLQEMMQGKLPSTRNAMCMHACMMEGMGVLKNGKQSPKTAIALAKQISNNNPTIIKLITDVTRECATVHNSDRCEMAFKMIQCSIEATKKYGPATNSS